MWSRFSAAGLVSTLLLVVISESPRADIYPVSHTDELTEKTTTGFRIASDNDAAGLYFLCDESRSVPRILFHHQRFLTSTGQTFELAYRIDDGDVRYVEFVARPDSTSGRYDPGMPGADWRSFSAWQKWIYGRIVNDFARGQHAIVRVWNHSGRSFTYRFDVSDFRRYGGRLSDCFSTSWSEVQDVPPAPLISPRHLFALVERIDRSLNSRPE